MYDSLATNNQIQLIEDLINSPNTLAIIINRNNWTELINYAKVCGYTKIELTVTSNASVGYTSGITPDGEWTLADEDYKFSRGESKIYERDIEDYESLDELVLVYFSTTQAQAAGQAVVNQDFRILVKLKV